MITLSLDGKFTEEDKKVLRALMREFGFEGEVEDFEKFMLSLMENFANSNPERFFEICEEKGLGKFTQVRIH